MIGNVSNSKKAVVISTLVNEIVNGKYVPLGPFPSERQLMERFKASRVTVRSAVQDLEARGFVYRRRGSGTFVSGSHTPQGPKIGTLFSGARYSEIFLKIADEIARIAQEDKCDVVRADASMLDYSAVGRKAVELARELVSEGVKGVVLQPVEFSEDRISANNEILRTFRQAEIPVVLVDCDLTTESSGLDLVSLDNFSAGRDLAFHLQERRVKRILFLARQGCADSVWRRLSGVESVFGEGAVDRLFVPNCSDVEGLRSSLSKIPRLDAIVCQNDVAAVNVQKALGRMELTVPRDVMLAGFDDVSLTRAMKPGLTTVRQPCDLIAQEAYKRLRERMDQSNAPTATVALRGELMLRGSTDVYR